MMPSHHWARNFTVEKDDIEYLTNLLLERETPLDTETLTRVLIETRITKEVATLRQPEVRSRGGCPRRERGNRRGTPQSPESPRSRPGPR